MSDKNVEHMPVQKTDTTEVLYAELDHNDNKLDHNNKNSETGVLENTYKTEVVYAQIDHAKSNSSSK